MEAFLLRLCTRRGGTTRCCDGLVDALLGVLW